MNGQPWTVEQHVENLLAWWDSPLKALRQLKLAFKHHQGGLKRGQIEHLKAVAARLREIAQEEPVK